MTSQHRDRYRRPGRGSIVDAMTQLDDRPAQRRPDAPRRRLLFRDLDRPADAFSTVGPNWYASVMGTGIVAIGAASLPVDVPGLHTFGAVVWLLASALLVVLLGAWALRPGSVRRYAHDPVLSQFWGAVAMGVMTVGAGSVKFGTPFLGAAGAIGTGWVLWGAGTVLGLVTAVWIPYMMIVHHDIERGSAFGGWLMPVVPPMVSAANGAALVPHAPAGAAPALVVACYAMFGVSLFATLAILPQIWNRLVVHGTGPAATVPTMWIVLGPFGQSVTAANLLGDQAGVLGEPFATGAHAFGFLYGVPAWGFAMVWLALAAAVTVRTARRGLPFALTWWSFTFPVGTCVTGTAALAGHLHVTALVWVAVGLFVFLVAAWATVAVRTAHGALVSGRLLAPA